jgi:transcriptional regulator with XRE-family HTH domain
MQTSGLAFKLAICKLAAMTPTELAAAAGISVPYASQLLSGDRGASLPVALGIYDKTGLQFGILKGLGPDTIAALRKEAA